MMLALTQLLLHNAFKADAYVAAADDVAAETKLLNGARHLADTNSYRSR